MVTGSWDRSVRLWDPRTPCNAGTFSQPEKVQLLLPVPQKEVACKHPYICHLQLCLVVTLLLSPWQVYTLSVAGDRLIVGTAGRRVLVWDLRNMGYVQQRRESSLKYQTRCIRAFPNKQVHIESFWLLKHRQWLKHWSLSTRSMASLRRSVVTFLSLALGLRLEFNWGTCSCGVPGPKPGSSEEEVCLQVPQAERGWNWACLPGQRHLIS